MVTTHQGEPSTSPEIAPNRPPAVPKKQSLPTIWTHYLAARLATTVLTGFNVRANLRSARRLGRLMYRFDHRHRERAMAHIRLAFPAWSDAKVREVTRGSFEHFTQLAVEVCHGPRMITLDTWADRARLANLGPALDLLNAREPMIAITGHVGNWEVLGTMMSVLGYPLEVIVRPLDNPLLNDWLLGVRERHGLKAITKWDATGRMMDVLDRGETLAFTADQNAGDRGLFVPFFGKLASAYKSIGVLAIRRKLPIVCGYAHRVGTDFRFEVGCADVILPAHWKDHPDPLYYITARYVRAFETMVRMQPNQFLWMHRRWKSRPRHERQGKTMPDALRRQLQSLPWMTDDLLASCTEPLPKMV